MFFVPFFIDSKTTWTVEARWVLLLIVPIVFALIIFFGLLDMLNAARQRAYRDLPKTLRYFKQVNKDALLLEASDLYSIDGTVSIFYKTPADQGGVEQSVGIGRIMNVQEDGKIQVLVFSPVEPTSEIWTRIRNNDAGVVSNMVVKPSIPHSILEDLLHV